MNLWSLVLILIVPCVFGAINNTLDSRNQRQELRKKYMKRLQKDEGSLKLVGGRDDHEGNVEVLHSGKWGLVCDDEWDKNEAEVVCRQLGYNLGGKVTHSSTFGKGNRRFWMDNLFCTGKENNLSECRFDGWGVSDCEDTEVAGVICNAELSEEKQNKVVAKVPKFKIKKQDVLKIRLVGGRIPEEGRVEVQYNTNEWGDICSDGWGLLEANVVCKELGLGFANEAFQTDFFGGSNGTKIVLSGTECRGHEKSLSQCKHHSLAHKVKCHGDHNHVAAVSCVTMMADLVIDEIELQTTAHLEDRPMYFLQCAMEENCVASQAYEIQRENVNWHADTRRLLKFTAKVLNNGTADFRPHIPKNQWEFHLCHMHYHSMEVFATFDIINDQGEKIAEGHKASFCLEDNVCKDGTEPVYSCTNYGDQGISVNCWDVYKYNIDCQWIDITEIDFGQYTFKVSINPEFKVPEMSFENNGATCTLLYTEQYAKVFNCKIDRP